MPTTAKGYRYPASSDAPNGPTAIQQLAQDVNDKALPVFSAAKFYAYRNTNQSIAGSLTVPATIVFDAARAGGTGMSLNGTTGVLTIAAGFGGEYTVFGAVAISEVGPSRVFATVFINGVEILRGLDIINRGATTGDVVGSVVSGPLTLSSGDQVTMRALHTGAAATVAPGEFITWMQLRRIS